FFQAEDGIRDDLVTGVQTCALPILTALRTLSISAGLEASTVTPGRTAPELSLTTPAIPLAVACCADAARGSSSAHMRTVRPTPTTLVLTMDFLLPHRLASRRDGDTR